MSEKMPIPEVATIDGLDKAIRTVNLNLYHMPVQYTELIPSAALATAMWTKANREFTQTAEDSAEVITSMLNPERYTDSQSDAARIAFEGVLIGLMTAEQWVGKNVKLETILNSLAVDVLPTEDDQIFIDECAKYLYDIGSKGYELLSDKAKRSLKVWYNDLAHVYGIEESLEDIFNMAFGIPLFEGLQKYERSRFETLVVSGHEDMKHYAASPEEYDWNAKFAEFDH